MNWIRYLVFGFVFLSFVKCVENSGTEKQSGDEKVDSLELLTNEISLNPDDIDARKKRAEIFHKNHAFGAALKDIDYALKIDSIREDFYLLKSTIEMDYFRSLEAIRTLRKAAEIHPASQQVREQLGEFQLILKQYSSAIKTAEEILEINPHSAKAYLIMGMAAREQQDTIAAMKYYNQAVNYNADLLDAWVEMARLEMKRNPLDAAPYFESAIQIAPENISLLHAYAMYWQNLDSLENAKNTYKKISEIQSDYIESYYNHALILMDQDSFAKAVSLWDEFLKFSETKEKGYYYRGISYEMMAQPERAYEDYLNAKEENPELPHIDEAIESVKAKIGE